MWQYYIDTPSYYSWCGHSFETVCLNHIPEIKKILGIEGIDSLEYSYFDNKKGGAQIDLIIDRKDNVINLCEMKFSEAPYTITKDYEEKLRNRLAIFKAKTKTRKSLSTTMVTTYGVLRGIHSGIVQNEVVMDDLFRQ